jgi:hypothetical protein
MAADHGRASRALAGWRWASSVALTALLAGLAPALAQAPGARAGAGVKSAVEGASGLIVDFARDPLQDPNAIWEGDAFERVSWEPSPARFPGDAPGHAAALYRSDRPAGRLGWALPQALGREDTFTAAAVIVLDPDHFEADPMGFFQVSWGLWNSGRTGMDRSGGPQTKADTYQLLEWDYFPNVSPFFGGPYLSPSVFGVKLPGDPDAFANFSFASTETSLPLGVPLLTTIEHRAGLGAAVVSVQEVTPDGALIPINGAMAVVPLDWLVEESYALDRAGLTMWRNGFEEPGGDAQLDARIEFHLLAVREGRIVTPEQMLEGAAMGARAR